MGREREQAPGEVGRQESLRAACNEGDPTAQATQRCVVALQQSPGRYQQEQGYAETGEQVHEGKPRRGSAVGRGHQRPGPGDVHGHHRNDGNAAQRVEPLPALR